METTFLITIISLSIAGITQVIKDSLKLNPKVLRWVIPALAGSLAVALSVQGGEKETVDFLVNIIIGVFVPAGAHNVALQGDTMIGRILKGMGNAIFKS